jgi:AraC-like DNA-binding protein
MAKALTLDQLLDGLEFSIDPFALCEVRDHGQLSLGNMDHATLHYTLAGQGSFHFDLWDEISVSTGTIVIVPANHNHQLGYSNGNGSTLPNCKPLTSEWQLHRDGMGPDGILVACGRISATYKGVNGLFEHLQKPIFGSVSGHPYLQKALGELLSELAESKPGSVALAQVLMQQCLIEIIRDSYDEQSIDNLWFSAANNQRLWDVLATMFDHPEKPHSLESLADLAGMSRSSMVEHFTTAFGRSPIDLLREIRLRKAARLLESSDLPVKTVANRVGYTSRSYFSRAFKAYYKKSPAQFRTRNGL